MKTATKSETAPLNLTEEDMDNAARQLARSEKGRQALRDTLAMLNNGGISLDGRNAQAVMTLLYGAFTRWPGYSREAMAAVLDEGTQNREAA